MPTTMPTLAIISQIDLDPTQTVTQANAIWDAVGVLKIIILAFIIMGIFGLIKR